MSYYGEWKMFKQEVEIEEYKAKIRRQAAEITRLLAENKELKAENGNVIWEIEQAFDRGCNAAWKLALKLRYMDYEDKVVCFGLGYDEKEKWVEIMEKYTYTEAAAKVAEWENAKEEIKVGDVLEGIYDNEVKCIVTNLCPDNMAYLVFDDGTAGVYELDNLKKTGRHIDIDSFLKQIGGEQE